MKKFSYENLQVFVREADKRYAKKMDSMTKEEIAEAISTAIAGADHLKRKKVDSLEEIDTSTANADKYIYMIAKETPENNNTYDEYMMIDGSLEKVGSTNISLEGYLKEDDFEDYTEEEMVE